LEVKLRGRELLFWTTVRISDWMEKRRHLFFWCLVIYYSCLYCCFFANAKEPISLQTLQLIKIGHLSGQKGLRILAF